MYSCHVKIAKKPIERLLDTQNILGYGIWNAESCNKEQILRVFNIQFKLCINTILFFQVHYDHIINIYCRNPTLRKCEDETHTPEMGTWESFGTPETSKFDCKGQNTSHWGVLYIIGKLSKFRGRKWACMGHLDICSTRYGKKKGRESNCQFDSQPLKVRNQLNPGACRWSATHYWKALEESYKFSSDLIPIGGLSKELWPRKVPRIQIGTVSGLLLGSPGTKSHSDVGATERRREYYMGEGGGFPWIWAVMSLVSPELLVTCLNTKGAPESELTNVLVGLM